MESELVAYLKETLASERWFVSKSKKIEDLKIEDMTRISTAGKTYLLFRTRVSFSGSSDTYNIYLREDNEEMHTYSNALGDPDFINYLYHLLVGSSMLTTASGRIEGENSGLTKTDMMPFSSVRLLRVEQSNSSVALDNRIIMKFYRRETDYFTPDYQIPKALDEQTDYSGTPECLGSIYYSDDGERSLLVTLSRYVENEGDCWSVFTEIIRESILSGSFSTETLSREIEAIGKATAELHNAMASLHGDFFTPAQIGVDDFSAWQKDFEAGASVFHEYRPDINGFPAYDELLAKAKTLLESLIGERMVKIRIHGDYHLGQVLRSGEKYYIIDFEGEPLRSLTYRRERQSPLKDVAGMVRSINYAMLTCTYDNSDPEVQRLGTQWADVNSKRFVSSYIRSVNHDLDYIPEREDTFSRLLDFFVLERAVYELGYEINNRPAWAKFPLDAILKIMKTTK